MDAHAYIVLIAVSIPRQIWAETREKIWSSVWSTSRESDEMPPSHPVLDLKNLPNNFLSMYMHLLRSAVVQARRLYI
jgi:hypothetical protein